MRTFTIFTFMAATAAATDPSLVSLLMPSATPTAADPWWCAIENYSEFFNPPQPTGALSSAIMSYGDKLVETCTAGNCPFPDATKWCQFTATAPPTVLPAYTSYAQTASAWWANHSSSAVQHAQDCPQYWFNARFKYFGGLGWLNQTIIHGECIAGSSSGGNSSKITNSGGSQSSATSKTSPVRRGLLAVADRKVSPDGTCGGENGFVCSGSKFGNCCSSDGQCGTSEEHCDNNCQSKFGLCQRPRISPHGYCGQFDNKIGYSCAGSDFGDCCSASGVCGDESFHCGGGCQSPFGKCSTTVNALTAAGAPSPVSAAANRVGVALSTLVATGTSVPLS